MRAGFLCPKCDNFACLYNLNNQNPHQTVTHFGCVGFLMYACGFFVPQIRQFCLFIYPPKWASSENTIFFLEKSKSSVSWSVAIFPRVVQAWKQPYSFGGRIKLIICRIRHELSVSINDINTCWKKTVKWRILYFVDIFPFSQECLSFGSVSDNFNKLKSLLNENQSNCCFISSVSKEILFNLIQHEEKKKTI